MFPTLFIGLFRNFLPILPRALFSWFFRNTEIPTKIVNFKISIQYKNFALEFRLEFVFGFFDSCRTGICCMIELAKTDSERPFWDRIWDIPAIVTQIVDKNLSWILGFNWCIGHSSMIILPAPSVVRVVWIGIFKTGTVLTYDTLTVTNIWFVLNYGRIDRVWIFRTGTVDSHNIKTFIKWFNSGVVRTTVDVYHYLSKKRNLELVFLARVGVSIGIDKRHGTKWWRQSTAVCVSLIQKSIAHVVSIRNFDIFDFEGKSLKI